MTYSITHNPQFNSYEVKFDSKPSEAVRDALKALKMRWNFKKACWYGFASESEIINAILGCNDGSDDDATVVTDGYMGGGAVYGSKSNIHVYGTDLAKLFRADLKKAGIKATVRCGKSTYTDKFTVTVKVTADDFIPLDDFIANYSLSGVNWVYTEDGRCIHRDAVYSMDADEYDAVIKSTATKEYNSYFGKENSINHYYLDRYDFLTKDCIDRLKKVNSIISAYRYDESNGMVDYFDTNFYYDIYIKF